MKRFLSSALLAGSLAACGGGDSAKDVSCSSPSQGHCLTWTISQPLLSSELPVFESVCNISSAAAVSACPSENRVGRCSGTNGNEANLVPFVWSYYAPIFTTDQVQALCDSAGGTTFTPN